MMMIMKNIFLLFGLFAVIAYPALAQNYGSASQMGADISRLEEQIRQIRGDNERLQHQVQQLQDSQKRFQEDIEFRLNNGTGDNPEMSISSPKAPIIVPPMPNVPPVPAYNAPEMGEITIPPTAGTGFSTSPDPQVMKMPNETPTTPRELYNQAFRLLNQTDYDGAEHAFSKFIDDFSSDPLIGNAWYWLGETFYVRRNYVRAADSFRQGFKAMEGGPKAGDNLLKLAMSLAALEKDQEACVVLHQVDSKYSKNSSTLKGKIKQELNRLGC